MPVSFTDNALSFLKNFLEENVDDTHNVIRLTIEETEESGIAMNFVYSIEEEGDVKFDYNDENILVMEKKIYELLPYLKIDANLETGELLLLTQGMDQEEIDDEEDEILDEEKDSNITEFPSNEEERNDEYVD